MQIPRRDQQPTLYNSTTLGLTPSSINAAISQQQSGKLPITH